MLRYHIIQEKKKEKKKKKKMVGSHVALQWNSFLGLNHNNTELVKFLVSEWEKKNIKETNLCDLWRKMCLLK